MPETSFILASGSPQRKRILRELGISFEAIPADIDEETAMRSGRKPEIIAKELALKKAEFIAEKHPGRWVIGCDTIVVSSKGEILGKPKDEAYARRVLRGYRKSFCDVYSGLALVRVGEGSGEFVQFEKSRLEFNDFSDEDIEEYLKASDRWKESSGSMTIEGAEAWIKELKGDYWNVVGLPVVSLKEMLKNIMLI